MPTYTYETIPQKKGQKARTFEVRQSMKDPALTAHPETGEPVRRVISGGLGLMISGEAKSSAPAPAPSGAHCCGGGCGCHHLN